MTKTGLQQDPQIVATARVRISFYETLAVMEGVRFFAPTIELTEQLMLRVEQERNKELVKIRQDPSQIEKISAEEAVTSGFLSQAGDDGNPRAWQRMIAQEFYHHLTFLTDSQLVEAKKPFSMQKVVARSMGNLLGLSREEELLRNLAEQFSSWLSDEGEFIAGWGRIILADNDRFYLEKFLTAEDEENIPPTGLGIKIHGRNEPVSTVAKGES